MTVEIRREHADSGGRYVAEVDGTYAGRLTYRMPKPDSMVVDYTESAPAMRGKGVAYALVEQVAADAAEEGFRILPLCWYAREKLQERAEWRSLIEGART